MLSLINPDLYFRLLEIIDLLFKIGGNDDVGLNLSGGERLLGILRGLFDKRQRNQRALKRHRSEAFASRSISSGCIGRGRNGGRRRRLVRETMQRFEPRQIFESIVDGVVCRKFVEE